MGWTAAGGTLAPTAQVLFFILFLWQVPHFLAIAWKYRDQYRAAGCPLYAVLDEGGAATARQAVLYTAALAAVSVLPWGYGLTGPLYGVGALALGAAFLAAGVRFLRERTTPNAMRLFFTSIIYLPLLLALLMIDVRV
jgi:protoheme IX farnesyltransferase